MYINDRLKMVINQIAVNKFVQLLFVFKQIGVFAVTLGVKLAKLALDRVFNLVHGKVSIF